MTDQATTDELREALHDVTIVVNGVEYNGQRVQRKAIHEGDTFRVCDHELRFSYQ